MTATTIYRNGVHVYTWHGTLAGRGVTLVPWRRHRGAYVLGRPFGVYRTSDPFYITNEETS